MSVPSSNVDEKLLSAAVINHLNDRHQITYAQIGSDLKIIQTSDNFSFLLSPNMKTAVGQHLTSIFDEFVGVEDTLQAIINDNLDDLTLDYVARKTADGTIHYLNFRILNLEKISSTNGLLLIIEDVTSAGLLNQRLVQNRNELRLAQEKLNTINQELLRLNEFKSFLLSMLAHDMRTPLGAVRGYAELILRMLEPERVKLSLEKTTTYASTICSITDQMTWLIRDLIDFDRAEKGLLTVNLTPCSILQLIQETVEMQDAIIKDQDLQIVLDINPPTFKMLADKQRLRQIINNLVGNAIKYTPRGGQITISTRIEGQESALTIADNGRGMTPEQLEALFQPYYRTKEALSSTIVGSGLGLFIVESLANALNGRIDVSSEVGRGSAFTLYLPLASSVSPENAPATPE